MTEPTTPKAAGRKVSDVELCAMHDCLDTLADLDPAARGRVLQWLWERHHGRQRAEQPPAQRPDPRENGGP